MGRKNVTIGELLINESYSFTANSFVAQKNNKDKSKVGLECVSREETNWSKFVIKPTQGLFQIIK